MKRLFSVLLIVALTAGLAVPAFAADTIVELGPMNYVNVAGNQEGWDTTVDGVSYTLDDFQKATSLVIEWDPVNTWTYLDVGLIMQPNNEGWLQTDFLGSGVPNAESGASLSEDKKTLTLDLTKCAGYADLQAATESVRFILQCYSGTGLPGLGITSAKLVIPGEGGDDPIEVESAAVTVATPKTGAAPATTATVEAGANYTVTGVTWTAGGELVTGNFQGGTAYTALVELTANEGYTFAHPLAATVNGQVTDVNGVGGETVEVFYTFPKTAPTGEGLEVVVDVNPLPISVTVTIFYNNDVYYSEVFGVTPA